MHARRNKIMRDWAFAMLIGIAGIVVVIIVGIMQIEQRATELESEVASSREVLKVQKMEETSKQVEEISNNFKLVTQVLSRQVLFSEVLKQVGAIMPDGSSLSNLSIEEISGGIDLQVEAVDYQTATQVQVNLQDSANKLFEEVDIINITCTDNATGDYPCKGAYRAKYTSNNPFLFLNYGAVAP